MFPLEFWNKWYTIGKPLYRALWIRKKNWAWHHPMDGHAHLTEKASLLLKPVWSLPWQKSFQFQNCFQLPLFRAFFWGMSLFSRTTGLEMAGRQSSKSEKHSGKPCILLHKSWEFGLFFRTSNFAILEISIRGSYNSENMVGKLLYIHWNLAFIFNEY